MIGKIVIGRSFGNLCRYALDEEKEAQVLAASGVRIWSPEVMEEDFNDQRLLRPGLGRAVLHVALAWPSEEMQKLSNDVMVQLAMEYMEEMDIEPATTQWALVRHYDQDHPHAHLLINRVTNDGNVIPDTNNFDQSAEACRTVEENNGLINAGELGEQRHRQLVERHALGEREAVKLKVKDALDEHLIQSTSVEQLTSLLAEKGVETRGTFKEGKLEKVLFVYVDHPELPIKGSELGPEYGGNKLYETLETYRYCAEEFEEELAETTALTASKQVEVKQEELIIDSPSTHPKMLHKEQEVFVQPEVDDEYELD